MGSITVDATTTLVLINTALYPTATVILPALTQNIAQLTVRDNAGAAGVQIKIRTDGAIFAPSPILTDSTHIYILQPFGFVTLSYNSALNLWSVLDSFGFQNTNTFLAQQVTVSTIQVVDSVTPNTLNSIAVANGVLQLNGQPLTGGSIPNPFNASNINASTMTLSQNLVFSPTESNVRLNVSGAVQTNFLTLNDISTNGNVNLVLSNSVLYRNIYPLVSIAGYIEFAYTDGPPTVYPLPYNAFLDNAQNISNGPWNPNSIIFTSGKGYVSGFIALPGCSVTAFSSNDQTGDSICYIHNNTLLPIYSNINTRYDSDTNYLGGSYRLFNFNIST